MRPSDQGAVGLSPPSLDGCRTQIKKLKEETEKDISKMKEGAEKEMQTIIEKKNEDIGKMQKELEVGERTGNMSLAFF